MRPDDSGIDHLDAALRRPGGIERFQHCVPYARHRPAPELPVDGTPLAELLGQIAPWCAGSRDPEHPIEHQTVIAGRPPRFGPVSITKGSKKAHSLSDISPRATLLSAKNSVELDLS